MFRCSCTPSIRWPFDIFELRKAWDFIISITPLDESLMSFLTGLIYSFIWVRPLDVLLAGAVLWAQLDLVVDPRLSSQPTSQSSDGEARAQNWPPPPRDVNVPPGRLLISRGASLSASSIREPGNPATPLPPQVLGCLARRQWGVSCEWNGAKMGCSRSAEPSH